MCCRCSITSFWPLTPTRSAPASVTPPSEHPILCIGFLGWLSQLSDPACAALSQVSHYRQYPPGTQYVYSVRRLPPSVSHVGASTGCALGLTPLLIPPLGTPDIPSCLQYFESRGGKFPDVCFFGLQYFIKRYLVGQVGKL